MGASTIINKTHMAIWKESALCRMSSFPSPGKLSCLTTCGHLGGLPADREFLSSDPSLDRVLQNFRSAGCPLLQTETVGLRENKL